MKRTLERLLLKGYLQYRLFTPPDDQIGLMAAHWLELIGDELAAFDEEEAAAITEDVFMEFFRTEPRFPTPNSIRERLTAAVALRKARKTSFQMGTGTKTPGIGKIVVKALKGDEAARRRLKGLGW